MKPGHPGRIKAVGAALLLLAAVAAFWAPELADRAIVVERDGLSSILPVRFFLAEALRAGEWPTWDPNPVLGKPFLAEWQPATLYPPSIWLLVPPFSRGFNLFFVFHYLGTALGALLWLRAVGLGNAPALAGALVWTLGGPLVSLGTVLNHLLAVAWLPWVAWAWERGTGATARVAASAAMLALALLPGSPEMALLCAGGLVLAARHPAALLALPLAAALAAVQLVPVGAYLGETMRSGGLAAERVLEHSASLRQLLGFAAPFAPDEAAPFLASVYDGPVAIVLAAIALAAAPRRLRLAVVLSAALLVVLALGHRTPVLPALLDATPLAASLRYPQKLLLGLHALVAAGAAFGASWVLARARGRAAGLLAAAIVAGIAIDLSLAHRGRLTALSPHEILAAPAIAEAMRSGVSADDPPGAAPRYYSNAVGGPEARSPEEAVRLDRELLFAGTGELFGLANLNRPDSLNLVAHDALHRRLGEVGRERALSALSALGARWVTSWRPLAGSAIATEVRPGSDRAPFLYRLEGAQPRAFLAARVEVAASAGAALDRFLAAPPGDHRGFAVLEESAGARDLGGSGAVRWTEYASDRLGLEVSVDSAGRDGALLVVVDSFLAGWSAAVDGEAVPILRVNGLARGVAVGPGRHRVEMRYRPPGLVAGGLVTALAAAVLALAWVRRNASARRAAETDS